MHERTDTPASARSPGGAERGHATTASPTWWREPSAADRCTAAMAAVTRDIFTWHHRGGTVRTVEPGANGGVRLGVGGLLDVTEAQALLGRHYGFPVACYVWP